MIYLADTSALVRLQREQVDPAWNDIIERGLVVICEPSLTETMKIATAKQYHTTEERLRLTYPWATVPDDIWALVAAIGREVVEPSAYHDPSVADLVIAAAAIRLKLTVLHEDGDFETIARYVPELRQHRISAPPE